MLRTKYHILNLENNYWVVITIKSYIRDYAISAFIFYSINNKSVEDYKHKLYLDTLNEFKSFNVPFNNQFYENKLIAHKSEIDDMEAVYLTIIQLQDINRFDILRCLDIVYFSIKQAQISKRLISCNVTKASLELFLSERTIYNYLNKAINMFTVNRGLRA